MALGANIHSHFFLDRARVKYFTASAGHLTFAIGGMYILFHILHPFLVKSQLSLYHKDEKYQALFQEKINFSPAINAYF
jgi:hypothetical protein